MRHAIALLALLPGVAVAEPHPFNVHDLVALQRITDPAASPDGKRVAFALRTTDLEANKGRTDLWMVGADGAGLRQLTFSPENESSPRFAPDGKSIYFLSTRGGTSAVWRLPLDGGEARKITDLHADVNAFVLSPDGHHYAFAGTRDGQTFVIKDGATLASHHEGGASTFAFSPDSQHLAYAAGNGLNWFVCVDGAPGAAFSALGATPIAFSPDSSRVAFAALTAQKTWRLIIGKDAGVQSKAYDAFLKGSHVAWRPDGTVVTIAIQKKVALRIEAKP